MAAPREDLLGRTIAGKYVIESFLGGGAMGAVYRARQATLEKVVAIKVLHRELAVAGQLFVARFQREARAASRLDHPNSIRVLDYGEEPDGLLYIAMELAEGRDLYQVASEESRLGDARIVNILSQVLAALAVAHEMGVIHRDLKPENILVVSGTDDEGASTDFVKVCDFGIATIADPRSDKETSGPRPGVTSAGMIVGTPEYMSPEQARGEPVDARSDLYSLGVVLYRLLTGALPFEAESALGVVVKQIYEEPSHPSMLHIGVNRALEAVCLKAMKKSPAERYQSAREMRAALRAALEISPSILPLLPLPPIDPESPVAGTAFKRVGPAPTLVAHSMRASPPSASSDSTSPSTPRKGLRPHHAALVVVASALIAIAIFRARPSSTAPEASPPSAASDSTSPTLPVDSSVPAAAPSPADPQQATSTAQANPPASEQPLTAPSGSGAPQQPPSAPPRGSLADAYEPSAPTAPPDPSHSAAPAATAAVTSAPTITSAPASAPVASTAALAPTAEPTALDVTTARVAVTGVSVSGGIAGSSVRVALARAGFTRCYQDALRRAGSPASGTATVHLAIDETGRVRSASASGMGFLPGAKSCIEGAARGVQIPNVDTGDATADATLSFVPH